MCKILLFFLHNLSFGVLSRLDFWVLSEFELFNFVKFRFFLDLSFFFFFFTIWFFFFVLSQFEFLNFVTIWVSKFYHNLSSGISTKKIVLSQFEFWLWSQFEFCHKGEVGNAILNTKGMTILHCFSLYKCQLNVVAWYVFYEAETVRWHLYVFRILTKDIKQLCPLYLIWYFQPPP